MNEPQNPNRAAITAHLDMLHMHAKATGADGVLVLVAEAERTRLQQIVTASDEKVDTVVTLLPRVKDRYRDVIEGIGAFSPKHLPQARQQLRTLVGEIWLTPVKEGHLVATLTGLYDGLVKLLSGGKLNRDGCGGRI